MHSVLTQCVRGQGHTPDYMYLLQRMMMDNPQAAVSLAKMVAKQPGPPIELNTMADLFLQRSMVREATEFLLDVLTENKPEHDKMQTKVLPSPAQSVKLLVDIAVRGKACRPGPVLW